MSGEKIKVNQNWQKNVVWVVKCWNLWIKVDNKIDHGFHKKRKGEFVIMLLKNKAVKAIAGAVILSCIMGGNVYAASSPTSVVIYSNDSSATSTSINCTGYIDGYGVNDVSSTRSLYYTLR